jgi:type II secretory pathway pseudopilin PulG
MRTRQRGFSMIQITIVVTVVLAALSASLSLAVIARANARETQLLNELLMLREGVRKGWQNQLNYTGLSNTTLLPYLPPESVPLTNAYGFPWTAAPFAWASTADSGMAFSAPGIPTSACVSIVTTTAPMWRQIRVTNGANTPLDAHAAGVLGRNADLGNVNTACSQAKIVTVSWIDL